jgi:hypothetical protein
MVEEDGGGRLIRLAGGRGGWTMEENIKNDVTRKTREKREKRINTHTYV